MIAYIPGWNSDLQDKVRKIFKQIKTDIPDANMVINAEIELVHHSRPFLTLYASLDCKGGVAGLIEIANRFTPIIDVELWHPQQGVMTFREKGTCFDENSFCGPPLYAEPPYPSRQE